MDFAFLQNKLVIAVLSCSLGVLGTIIVQLFLKKRGLFTFYVWHNRVGVSADDRILGSVRVTWNDRPVANLYTSTVELWNESLNDYENIIVKVFTNDAILLTERNEIVGTTRFLKWSESFADEVKVPEGIQPTPDQIQLVTSQREYLIPTFNRGQSIRFTFLNSAKTEKAPSIWLDIVHKGVRVKFRVARSKFMGVSRPIAVFVGILLGFVLLTFITASVKTIWISAVVSFIYGLFVLIPGTLAIKLWNWLRDFFAG